MGDLEKMKAGLWLHAICPEIGGALLRTEELVFRLNQLPPSRREEREAIIRQLFGHVGKSVCIHSPFHCDFGAQISVGDHFVGNFNLTILDEAPVTIGDHVFIGPNVGIYTVNHALLPDQRADDNRWPEWPRVCKTDYGQEEAVAVFGRDPRIYQTTVKELLTDSEGNLRAVKVVRLEAGTDKKTGRTVMHEVAGSEEELPCQLLLIAAGFLGPQAYVAETFGLERTPRSCVSTAPGGYATNVPKVFAAGDMRRGQSLVVWAIQEGRAAAHEVDTFLMGYSN